MQKHKGSGLPVDAADILRLIAVCVLGLTPIGLLWYLMRKPSSEVRMDFLGHIAELRRRFIVILVSFFTGSLLAFSLRIENWIPKPALQDNFAAQVFVRITEHLVPDNVQLIVTRPMDGFLAEMTIALAIGAALTTPVFLYQATKYIQPALREKEIRYLKSAIFPATLLFMAGAAFAWYAVLPFLLVTLYGYSEALGAAPLLSIQELVNFTLTMMFTLGIAFQTPLVMYVLTRAEVVPSKAYVKYWRHATVGIFVLSAILTDPTIISQMLVAGPLLGLYVLGIFAAKTGEKKGKMSEPA